LAGPGPGALAGAARRPAAALAARSPPAERPAPGLSDGSGLAAGRRQAVASASLDPGRAGAPDRDRAARRATPDRDTPVSRAATPGRDDQGDEYANNLRQTASSFPFSREATEGSTLTYRVKITYLRLHFFDERRGDGAAVTQTRNAGGSASTGANGFCQNSAKSLILGSRKIGFAKNYSIKSMEPPGFEVRANHRARCSSSLISLDFLGNHCCPIVPLLPSCSFFAK
jgi:hypothetical protein